MVGREGWYVCDGNDLDLEVTRILELECQVTRILELEC